MSVRLKRQQPATDTPTRRDFLALQDSIQLALDQIDGQTIGRNDIETWSIGGDQVQPGVVTEDHLEPFLLSALKYEVATDQSIAGDVAITFATKAYDGEGLVVGAKFVAKWSGVYRCNAAIRIEDDGSGGVQHGQTGRVVLYDETGATAVLLGQPCAAITDVAAADVIIAKLDETFEATAGRSYSIRYEMPYTYSTGVGVPVHHVGYYAGTVKAARTFSFGDNIDIAGSFVEFQPVAQPE